MVAPLAQLAGGDERILIGPETGDDAGVFRFEETSLVATVDFITPVCDDPVRFGRVAAANSLSDVWAMGGRPLFALNLCCFPKKVPDEAVPLLLARGAGALLEAGNAQVVERPHRVDDMKDCLAFRGESARE